MVPLGPLEGPLEAFGSALLVGYVALSVGQMRWHMLLLYVALGFATIALCTIYDAWPAILHGLARAQILAAFLPALMLLRATAEHRPEIAEARHLFSTLDAKARGRGILVGAHLIGGVLIIGVFALIAPIMGPDANEDERCRIVGIALRGMCLAVLWSPFFVGMGLASSYLPAVKLYEIMPMGLGFGALGILTSHLLFDRAGGAASLWRSLAGFAPVLPSIAAAAAVLVALTAVSPLTTLQAMIVGMPALCLIVLLSAGSQAFRGAMRRSWTGFGLLGNELAIVTFAMALGSVVESVVGAGIEPETLGRLHLAPIAIIGLAIGLVTLGGLIGLHPMVTVTVMLALLTSVPTGIADVVLLETMLFGWALSTMISVSAVSIATASAMFAVPPHRLVRGDNLIFVVVFGTLSVFILAAANRFLT